MADARGDELEIWDGAALGRLAIVQAAHEGWGEFIVNEYSRDGYTPLQLACFFGHEDVARYLVGNGAQIDAVSKNAMAIQPLHAAAAGSHTAIVQRMSNARLPIKKLMAPAVPMLYGKTYEEATQDYYSILQKHIQREVERVLDGFGRAA